MPLLCFVHIPKTAGNSLIATLQTTLGGDAVYWIGRTGSLQDWLSATGHEFGGYRAIVGHAPAIQFEKIPGEKLFVTLVRSPIERALSYFNYIVDERVGHELGPAMRALGLSRAVRESETFRSHVNDLQCHWIGGARRFDAARAALQGSGWIAGRIDALPAVIFELRRRTGIDLPDAGRLNSAVSDYMDRLLTPEIEAALRELNREDEKLFAFLEGPSAV